MKHVGDLKATKFKKARTFLINFLRIMEISRVLMNGTSLDDQANDLIAVRELIFPFPRH